MENEDELACLTFDGVEENVLVWKDGAITVGCQELSVEDSRLLYQTLNQVFGPQAAPALPQSIPGATRGRIMR